MSKTTKIKNGLYDALKFKFDSQTPTRGVNAADGLGNDKSGIGEPDDLAMGLRKTGEIDDAPLALDDTERVKVLSPGRLVTKRFFRNKLAMVGLALLILMFSFTFLGPLVYPYSQTALFYKYDYLSIDYASATQRTENATYKIPGGPELKSTIANSFNSYVIELEAEEVTEKTIRGADDAEYVMSKLGKGIYTLSTAEKNLIGVYRLSGQVATYNKLLDAFEWSGEQLSDGLRDAALAGIAADAGSFDYQGMLYTITGARNRYSVNRAEPEFSGPVPGDGFIAEIEDNLDGGSFEYDGKSYLTSGVSGGASEVFEIGNLSAALIGSTFVFNSYDSAVNFSDEFKRNALLAVYSGGEFMADGVSYKVNEEEDFLFITDASGNAAAALSTFSIRRYSGQDTLSLAFKETAQAVIERMIDDNEVTASFVFGVHEIDTSGNYVYDDSGEPVYVDSEITVSRKNTGEFVMTCEQITYLIDLFGAPSKEHILGTDGDGMDLLARMMYGGRVSLMVGFMVVFIEIILGVIMGGVSGFFSGWVDTLIMRIADVFYCIPTYPILIILGALFDKQKMDPYKRLVWMMITMGILGWAIVARLVRGQILSLREQEFMVAQEATGMRARRRIFRHLVPNVMPQLIVRATMGVGEVIIYESTLSFLGLGVKYPLATWGSMSNAVTSSAEAVLRYAYIWVPVGLLICLTVIAFNFAGDGLRDAFDPKMRR